MTRFVVAPAALRDIESVLLRTQEEWGERASLRYEALLTRAMLDVATNPELPGNSGRPEIAASARTYHLTHSRNHVPAKTGRVKRPRHFLLYRTRQDGIVEIGRVLHESMDLDRHLPDDYRASARSGDT
jgi:toxin ParE1/3/4